MTQKNEPIRFIVKTLFIGLDNSGKTSILCALEGKFTKILNLQPTKRISRTDFKIMGLPVKIWDMGGQKKYRNEYLADKKFFEETKLAFYVIYGQDPEKFGESLDYLKKILEIFEVLNLDPRIVVLLHKTDPDIKNMPDMLRNLRALKKSISELPNAVNLVVYETSIYEHENINDYFVQEILNILPKGKQIQDIVKNFMKTVEASAVMLIDENRLTIAEAY
ncbi:MAG TPA: ADP-ribosylation factor-like protein, partial [Candidatus Deferrimicrobium sp.]|nr:ADP-ribosylation factor-like protein [Candidatus Deferrimicrobium sp.]